MVDYTERRKTERKNVSPLHHRPTTERRNIKRKKNETVLNFIKQNYTERRKTERKKFLYVFTITSSGPPQREEILREILIIFRGDI